MLTIEKEKEMHDYENSCHVALNAARENELHAAQEADELRALTTRQNSLRNWREVRLIFFGVY